MTAPVVAAIVAAVVALVGAYYSRKSAQEAHKVADGIDRRRHAVEALDAQTESFRAAVAAYLEAVGHQSEGARADSGRVTTTHNLLICHPLCSPDLARAAEAFSWFVLQLSDREGLIPTTDAFRDAVRDVYGAQAEARRAALAGGLWVGVSPPPGPSSAI